MDSTRGGPLSTLILVLPLIVVPALVVLRPAERHSGVSRRDLAAADTENDQFLADVDDFDSVFGEEVQSGSIHEDSHDSIDDLLEAPLTDPGQIDSGFKEADSTSPTTSKLRNVAPASPRRTDSHRSFDLSRWGVTQTVWFQPGDAGATGLAVFVPVPSKTGSIRYRFEAIGDSDEQVVQDVVRQISDWNATPNTTRDSSGNQSR